MSGYSRFLMSDCCEASASAFRGQDDFRNAAEEFRQIFLLDSGKSEAWFKLGHEYLDLSARLAFRGARLQQFEPPADALAEVQGVTNENAEARYWLARTYQARGRDPIHNEG